MFKNWIKIAISNYNRNLFSTSINIFGLTMALTVFVFILLYWIEENSFEDWNPEKENIYLMETDVGPEIGIFSFSNLPTMRVSTEQIEEIENFVVITKNDNVGIKGNDNNVRGELYTSSNAFFDFFPFEIMAGDAKNALSNDNQIAVSNVVAQQLFPGSAKEAIGKKVVVDESPLVISAVYKLPESSSLIKPDFLVLDSSLKGNSNDWGNFNYFGFFKVKPGADKETIINKINDILYYNFIEKQAESQGKTVEEFAGKDPHKDFAILTRLDNTYLDSAGDGFASGDKTTLTILLSLSILILVLSSINFINLKTAQASKRAKEVGVRKTLGGNKRQLISQFLLEAFIICIISLLLAFVLIEVFLPTYNKFLNKELSLNNPKLYMYSAITLIFLTLISGIIPAVYLSEFKPVQTLKGNFSRSKHGIWLRNAILTFQLVISSFFIISMLIIYVQVNYMMDKDLGFNGDQSVIIYFQEKTDKPPHLKYEWLRSYLMRIPGVDDVTYSRQIFGNQSDGASNVNYAKEEKKILADHGPIDLNFFKFYDVKIVKGRDFNPNLSSDTLSNAIVNEAFVKEMGWTNENAIGKEVRPGFDTIEYKIIGVSEDFHRESVAKKVEAVLFFNYGRNWNRELVANVQVKLNKDDIEGTLERIQKFWEADVEPSQPMRYEFVNKKFAKTFDTYKRQQKIFTVLNAIVLIVALLGLFALSSLLIEQKMKTVAIKKTLGASTSQLIYDLIKQFIIICTLAVLISIPISYFLMNEWLKEFSYRVEMPWWPYVASLLILVSLTILVVSIKAYSATNLSLNKYLKYE